MGFHGGGWGGNCGAEKNSIVSLWQLVGRIFSISTKRYKRVEDIRPKAGKPVGVFKEFRPKAGKLLDA